MTGRDPRDVPIVERLSSTEERVRFGGPAPPDDLLLELGRLVHAALHLEAGVYLVASTVLDVADVRGVPVGSLLSKVRKAAETWQPSAVRDEVLVWRAACPAALQERNDVLHSAF